MWEAIRELQNAGATELSLGRTDRHDDGLLQFKRGWGGREIRLPYHRVALRMQSGGRKPRDQEPAIPEPVFPTRWSGACRYPCFDCWAESCTGTWDKSEGKRQLYRDGNSVMVPTQAQSTVTRVFSLISPEQRGHCATRDIRYSVKRGSASCQCIKHVIEGNDCAFAAALAAGDTLFRAKYQGLINESHFDFQC